MIMEHVRIVDGSFPNLDKLRADIETQQTLLDKALDQGDNLVNEGKFDPAYAAILRYTGLEQELPRVAAIIQAVARNHREKGQALATEQKWEEAIVEFKKSLEVHPDVETEAALKKAESDLETVNNKDAAARAVEQSKAFVARKQFVEAYEALSELPDGQRVYVGEEMTALKADYLKDLLARSGDLIRIHIPIRGRADEDAARQAFDFLSKAGGLQPEDDNIQVKLDLVSEKISEYYLAQGNRLLEKPRGSGVALGWHMLLEGQRFKRDFEGIRNQITKFGPAYEVRGRLSIAVQFRDQTSRRDSLGFADQMADTIASRMEAAGFRGVHILTRDRIPPPTDPNAVQPVYLLIGDINQHRTEKKVDTQRLNSKYRAGQREVRNPVWLEQSRVVEGLEREYQTAVENGKAIAVRNKKKEIEAANRQVEEIGKRIEEQKRKLTLIPETLLQDIIQPYNYIKRTFTLGAYVDVAVRASDSASNTALQADGSKVELPKIVSILENVKPEDTEGIVEEGSPPDEIQLLAEAEAKVQDEIVVKVRSWIESVPARVLQDARDALAKEDKEAAAEKYILYLNITPEKNTPERQEAVNFLRNEFNITTVKVE
ncbi:MAG: hypothetical protein HYX26_02235 [Acidobacteriales bacterium]|nr:hypothetical protein [Terriglobales bacterium]